MPSMNRRIGYCIVAIVVIWLSCSCESTLNDPSQDAPDDHFNTLRYDVAAPFGSLDPTAVDFGGSTFVFPMLYSYLFVPGDDGKFQPDLAIKWTFDPAPSSWTITLRDDAMFHNRRKVAANSR